MVWLAFLKMDFFQYLISVLSHYEEKKLLGEKVLSTAKRFVTIEEKKL